MLVAMYVQHVGNTDPNNRWTEDFDSETTRCLEDYDRDLTAQEYAFIIIDFFNNTLKPGEQQREMLSAAEIA